MSIFSAASAEIPWRVHTRILIFFCIRRKYPTGELPPSQWFELMLPDWFPWRLEKWNFSRARCKRCLSKAFYLRCPRMAIAHVSPSKQVKGRIMHWMHSPCFCATYVVTLEGIRKRNEQSQSKKESAISRVLEAFSLKSLTAPKRAITQITVFDFNFDVIADVDGKPITTMSSCVVLRLT